MNLKIKSIGIEIAQTRDHQVVNDHRHGFIEVGYFGNMANSYRELQYGFAKNIAWFGKVLTKHYPEMGDDEYLNHVRDEVIAPGLERYGFTVEDEPPEWHHIEFSESASNQHTQ